jgi:hypothetical protein
VAAVGLKTGGEQVERAAQLAEPMLLAFLARRAPDTHYTLGDWQRYFKLWRARVNLYAASAAITIGGAAVTGHNLWQKTSADSDVARLTAEAAQYDPLPQRHGGDAAARHQHRQYAGGGDCRAHAGHAIGHAAGHGHGDQPGAGNRAANPPAAAGLEGHLPAPTRRRRARKTMPPRRCPRWRPASPRAPQSLLLEAEILGQEDDYRGAVDSMNQFAQALAKHPRLTVEVDKPPVDTRPTVKLAGKAGPQAVAPGRAKFTLNLVWKP